MKKGKNKSKNVIDEEAQVIKPEEKPIEKKVDKIFYNDFNTGNLDTVDFSEIKVDSNFVESNMQDCYNADEYMEKKAILELTVKIFNESQWKNLSLTKKFPKELTPFIFQDLYKGLEGKGYDVIDIFICIAEFMDISYERIYEIAGLKMKEQLINAFENKYHILSNKHMNRLF